MAGAKKRRSAAVPAEKVEEGEDFHINDEDDDMAPVEELRVPVGQVKLTDEQLGEVFTKVITASDPNVPKKKTRFNYEIQEFEQANLEAGDHLKVHFVMDGDLILADSDLAREQETLASVLEAKAKIETESSGQVTKENDEGEYPADVLSGKLALKNQFNFSERASQTFNNPLRMKSVCTEPPPKKNYCAQISRWEIHDEYLRDLNAKQLAASLTEAKKAKIGSKGNDDEDDDGLARIEDTTGKLDYDSEIFQGDGMYRAMQVMERMVHTNSEAESFQEYKYFEDKSESKREDGRGQLYPLWRLMFEGAQRKTVTAVCWNNDFQDLLAVGYGSYDFVKQTGGQICCFTLKNTSYPEYVFETSSGVMSLDFHPVHSSLLCVGLYDGSVCVYDARESQDKALLYESKDPNMKHTDPVWQVMWSKDEDPLSFYSISSDGKVSLWKLSRNELTNETVTTISLHRNPSQTGDNEGAAQHVGLAGACAIDFNKKPGSDHLFLVGTEEGAIHSYSNQFNATYIRSFEGHHMAVYAVRWNHFHPDVFLSCSADWTVKLWEKDTPKPILTFDLNNPVGDIVWAPFSATVFAVITSDGKVRVYDLSVNKHDPVGEFRMNRKSKLTHIGFNPVEPIICVGDDRGVVQIFKLSTNLRKMTAESIDEIDTEKEIERLNEVMVVPEDEREEDINMLLEKAISTA